MIIEEFNNEEIEDADAMSDFLCQDLDEYCEGLWGQEGMTRQITEDDCIDEEESLEARLWTKKACNLIENHKNWLISLADKYFPEEDVPVESSKYVESYEL